MNGAGSARAARPGLKARPHNPIREQSTELTRTSLSAAVLLACAILAAVPAADEPLFVDDAAAAGLKFTHVNGASGHYYMAEQMGAGVALFDYDNDGDLDVFLVQGGPLDSGSPAKSPAPTPAGCFETT